VIEAGKLSMENKWIGERETWVQDGGKNPRKNGELKWIHWSIDALVEISGTQNNTEDVEEIRENCEAKENIPK
jgi:hypothetical protein